MREIAKRDNTRDLLTLTREEIYPRELPVVYNYNHLDKEI